MHPRDLRLRVVATETRLLPGFALSCQNASPVERLQLVLLRQHWICNATGSRTVTEPSRNIHKTSWHTTYYLLPVEILNSLRTEGAFGVYSMVDSEQQQHIEPPAGRISVFEKGRLVGSFESWRQAVQFIRANHLRMATLVPESHHMNTPKRSSPTVAM